MLSVHQPDPPGLIHDDLRLLPPWRGSSLFWGVFAKRIVHPSLIGSGMVFSVPAPVFIHRAARDDGAVSAAPCMVSPWDLPPELSS